MTKVIVGCFAAIGAYCTLVVGVMASDALMPNCCRCGSGTRPSGKRGMVHSSSCPKHRNQPKYPGRESFYG